jgi:AraC family transcriptional regulator
MASDYRPQVERAIAHILEHLGEPLTLAAVARVAHLSEFHFHRIFASVVGEPVGRFITRKRLELAALRLAYEPARPVTEIALDVGYSSVSNFSKAFASFFGCSPSQVRDPSAARQDAIGKLTRTYGKDFRPRDLFSLPEDVPEGERQERRAALARGLRYLDCPGFSVACLASPGGYDLAAIERTWAQLIEHGQALGLCGEDVDAYAMAFDSPQLTSPELQRYHACIPCPDGAVVPPPLFVSRIPDGRYAIFRYDGEVSGLEDHHRAIYSLWFPSSSVAPDDFTVVNHYVSDWPKDGRVTMDIWFKVRPKP